MLKVWVACKPPIARVILSLGAEWATRATETVPNPPKNPERILRNSNS